MEDDRGTVDAAELPTGQLVVSAHGAMDARIAGAFRDTVIALSAADGLPLIVDLRDAHGIDDQTLAVLATAAHLIRRRGERLVVVTRNHAVAALVESSAVGGIVTLRSTLLEVA